MSLRHSKHVFIEPNRRGELWPHRPADVWSRKNIYTKDQLQFSCSPPGGAEWTQQQPSYKQGLGGLISASCMFHVIRTSERVIKTIRTLLQNPEDLLRRSRQEGNTLTARCETELHIKSRTTAIDAFTIKVSLQTQPFKTRAFRNQKVKNLHKVKQK